MRSRRYCAALAAVVLVAGVTALAACGGGEQMADSSSTAPAAISPPASTSTATAATASPATPTTTPSVGRCPVDAEVCDFGRDIEGLLAAGQYDAIADRTHMFEYTCPGPRPDGAGGPFPLCEGATAGERRSGYSTGALQSEGAVESRDGLVNFIRGWVAGGVTSSPGTGAVIATVGCPLIGATYDCTNRFALVFTRGDGRSLLRFGVQRDGAGDGAQILQTITGLISVNPTMVSGGDDSIPVVFGIEESVGTRYFVLD